MALIAVIIILIMPRFLNLIVAIYLIFVVWRVLAFQGAQDVSVQTGTRGLRGTAQTWCKARISFPSADYSPMAKAVAKSKKIAANQSHHAVRAKAAAPARPQGAAEQCCQGGAQTPKNRLQPGPRPS